MDKECDEAIVMSGSHPEKPQAFLSKPYEFKKLNETIFQMLKAYSSKQVSFCDDRSLTLAIRRVWHKDNGVKGYA